MQARIAQAAADREATEREQEAEALKAAAQRDTALKLAGYQAERDRAMAQTAQAGPLADAEARKQVVVQETEVADLEAQREEKRLETTVKKPADAEAYRLRVEAVGQREARVELAEASKREVELKAEADARRIELAATATAKQTREVGAAEASATQAKGEAQGASIRATGLAEAEAIGKRAEALERESDAVIGQQLADKLPEIVAAAATAFSNVDNLTVLNGAQGISEIMNQVIGQAGPAMKMAKDALGTNERPGERRRAAAVRSPAAVATASIRSAARAVPRWACSRADTAASRSRTARSASSALDRREQLRGRVAEVSSRSPKPVSWTRWALSYWSQNSGRTTIGLPKCRHSVTVLLPPWVITASTCGRIEVWGRNSSPAMCRAARSSSCCGPLETITRQGASASVSTSRCISSTSAEPSEPSDEVDERAFALGQHRRQLPGASVARTLDCRLSQWSPSGRARG